MPHIDSDPAWDHSPPRPQARQRDVAEPPLKFVHVTSRHVSHQAHRLWICQGAASSLTPTLTLTLHPTTLTLILILILVLVLTVTVTVTVIITRTLAHTRTATS